jgi:sugar phosphate isomerase/epimerase
VLRLLFGVLAHRGQVDVGKPGERAVPTGYGFWCNAWPANPAWRFVAVGIGHDVAYWTEFLTALAEVDPDMAVNIEHEDADYSRVDGLRLAAENLTAAAKAAGV